MFRKTLFIASALLISFNAKAQFREDIMIQREISPEYARIVVAEDFARSENKKLSPVSDTMGNRLLSTINGRFIRGIQIDKDDGMNTLFLSGEVKGDHYLKYQIARNLVNSFAAYSVIDGKISGELPFDTIQDLSGQNLEVSALKVEKFRDEHFLVYNSNTEQRTYIEGNIGNQVNIQIQTSGPEHELRARDFLRSLSFPKINEALNTADYTKTLAEIKTEVNERSKDTKLIKSLFRSF